MPNDPRAASISTNPSSCCILIDQLLAQWGSAFQQVGGAIDCVGVAKDHQIIVCLDAGVSSEQNCGGLLSTDRNISCSESALSNAVIRFDG